MPTKHTPKHSASQLESDTSQHTFEAALAAGPTRCCRWAVPSSPRGLPQQQLDSARFSPVQSSPHCWSRVGCVHRWFVLIPAPAEGHVHTAVNCSRNPRLFPQHGNSVSACSPRLSTLACLFSRSPTPYSAHSPSMMSNLVKGQTCRKAPLVSTAFRLCVLTGKLLLPQTTESVASVLFPG